LVRRRLLYQEAAWPLYDWALATLLLDRELAE
jgi:hypothetical protein